MEKESVNGLKPMELREYQMELLDILKNIDRICRDNDIKYWLDSGTLLGAIRHKGFIPWDDDVDIGMMREDYEKFLTVAKNSLPSKLTVNEFNELGWTKVINNETLNVQKYKMAFTDKKEDTGIFVDIFPFDKFGNNSAAISYQNRIKHFINLVKAVKEPMDKPYFAQNRARNMLKIFLKIFFFYFKFIDSHKFVEYMKKKTKSMYTKYNKKNYKYAGYGYSVYSYRILYEIDNFYPLQETVFEGNKFFIPQNYDSYLKTLYGDYMKLPPENQRIWHNNGVYKLNDKVY